MSPEQLRGERLDFRSDIFSLGTVLYELIESTNPFARASEAETISAILTSEPPPLKKLNSSLYQLDHIVRRCLEKDRDKRYQSTTELLIELSRSPSPQRQLNPYRRGISFGMAILLACVVVLLVLYLRPWAFNSNSVLPSTTQPFPKAQVYSLAVMPLTRDSLDKNTDYLSDGLTESLTSKLSSLPELRVIPYTSVSGYKNGARDVTAIGQELKVDTLLLGHVVQRGNQLVLQSKLVKTADGSQIWTGEGEIKWQTIFNLEDQLAKSVTESLELRVVNEQKFLASLLAPIRRKILSR